MLCKLLLLVTTYLNCNATLLSILVSTTRLSHSKRSLRNWFNNNWFNNRVILLTAQQKLLLLLVL